MYNGSQRTANKNNARISMLYNTNYNTLRVLLLILLGTTQNI